MINCWFFPSSNSTGQVDEVGDGIDSFWKMQISAKRVGAPLRICTNKGGRGQKKGNFLWMYCLLMYLKNLEKCMENYRLCLSHYWSTPASSWDAMLRVTKVKLDLNSKVDMYLFLKKERKMLLIFTKDTVKYTIFSILRS